MEKKFWEATKEILYMSSANVCVSNDKTIPIVVPGTEISSENDWVTLKKFAKNRTVYVMSWEQHPSSPPISTSDTIRPFSDQKCKDMLTLHFLETMHNKQLVFIEQIGKHTAIANDEMKGYVSAYKHALSNWRKQLVSELSWLERALLKLNKKEISAYDCRPTKDLQRLLTQNIVSVSDSRFKLSAWLQLQSVNKRPESHQSLLLNLVAISSAQASAEAHVAEQFRQLILPYHGKFNVELVFFMTNEALRKIGNDSNSLDRMFNEIKLQTTSDQVLREALEAWQIATARAICFLRDRHRWLNTN